VLLHDTWERSEIHTEFYLESMRGADHLEDLDLDERLILKWTLKKEGVLDSPGSRY
jgi:hypothetical protein